MTLEFSCEINHHECRDEVLKLQFEQSSIHGCNIVRIETSTGYIYLNGDEIKFIQDKMYKFECAQSHME